MRFNKDLFLSNMKLLLSQGDVKPSVLEIKAGVSKGYYSRLSKSGNTSIPGIDFILAASELFGVSVESLISVDYSSCSENELYYIRFLERLISKTENGDMKWKSNTLKDFINIIDKKSDEELIVDRVPSALSMFSNSINGRWEYKSSFEYSPFEYEGINGGFFSVGIDKNTVLYMVKVKLRFEEETCDGIELFIIANHDKKSNVCCISPQQPQCYDSFLYRLYDTVKNSINVNALDASAKAIIDNFMGL